MTTADAVTALDELNTDKPPVDPHVNDKWFDLGLNVLRTWDGHKWSYEIPTGRSYTNLKPADALAHLREVLAAECDRFTRDTGLRVAAVKVKVDKESDEYRLEVHAR